MIESIRTAARRMREILGVSCTVRGESDIRSVGRIAVPRWNRGSILSSVLRATR